MPVAPAKSGGPPVGSQHRLLYERVIGALHALPARFQSQLVIEGVLATDLFTMNAPLGAAIEASVVESLNGLRQIWDPSSAYGAYTFVRQTQTFPDVLLRSADPTVVPQILMGIELKGWFAIAKEGKPSFRYAVGASCCAPADLLVVMPWIFDSVISGKPKLLQPIIVEAKFAAEMRNYHWEHLRRRKAEDGDRGVTLAAHAQPYPAKTKQYSDRANNDGGDNFGRIARSGGILDAEIEAVLAEDVLGIPVLAWHRFLTMFSDHVSTAEVALKLDALEKILLPPFNLTDAQRAQVIARAKEILEVMTPPPPPALPALKAARKAAAKKTGTP
jgi:hypothetical protein